MENDHPPEPGNWGTWLIHEVIHPLTVILPPAILLLLMTYFVLVAFNDGFRPGIRSFAAVLFPLSLVTFIFIFQKGWLTRLGALSAFASFLVSMLIGLIIMVAIRLYARSSAAPVTELVLSASFSLLVFSHASLRGQTISAYSYGMICGMLAYIIFLGFPDLR